MARNSTSSAEMHADVSNLFGFDDKLGPLKVIHVHNPSIGLNGVLVVHNVAAGPAIGGLRMATDVSTMECYRLARAMTYKNAAADLPHGGGKCVIAADPKMPDEQKEILIRGFAAALAHEEHYIFGPDMGTNEQCMGWVRDEIGRAVGLPAELGGIPLDQLGATGWGLYHAIKITLEKEGRSLEGSRVAIQGYGAVGYHTARFLAADGAKIVAVSDIEGAITNPNGLDTEALRELTRGGQSVSTSEDGEKIPRDELLAVPCDIWIPAARPDVIHDDNVDLLQAHIVAMGANIPITASAELKLYEKGVICLPDFIVNAGGVICGAMEYVNASQAAAFDTIRERISANTIEILDRSKRKQIPLRAAATELAEDRIHAAMATRRWRLY